MSKEPFIEILPISQGATPDRNNINKHTQRGGGLLENSLRRRGAFRSIASAGKGVDVPVVLAGNLTLQKAVEAGFTDVVNVHVTGGQIVNVVRDDLVPGSAEAIALGLEDNEIGKQSYNPDIDILAAVMSDPSMQTLRNEDKILADIVDGMGQRKIDYATEWQGMPEFEQDDLSAIKSIKINFASLDDYEKFCKLIGQNLTEKTRSTWYPPKKNDDLLSMVAHES